MPVALDTAAHGFYDAFDRLNQAAGRIARGGVTDRTADDMVDLLKARHAVAANAAVVRTADDMIGTLLDVLA
jgi:flagellar basal body rod protein FlgC